ncbi:permease prefix domain 1-containing protein [Actinophytocola sp.]|uniref:permease prefix domain 1-containing protein n=1 Tax=Actinophytocola sp. TaxID=1872138 RepID=UPI003D6A0613
MSTPDPIDAHVAALERVLRGPRQARRSMLAEARAGLRDAAAAYRDAGMAPARSAQLAVRDFGSVDDVGPLFQDELTALQGRRAALLIVLVFPAMLLGWDLLWSSGTVRTASTTVSDTVGTLAVLQDVLTVVVAAAALILLAVTFRRTVSPRRLATAIGVTGAAGALLCGGVAVAMNVAGGRDTTTMLTTNLAAVPALAVSGVVMVLIVWQAVSTLRVAGVVDPGGRRSTQL